ncbi:MAG: methionyl-tRNA formyltransferase [Planctomycetes bacterium]|nr:methionyl-tRNA formyltransferase [Planctomycetota bacterium]MCH9723499.1 methionyl-tRNA formyltransferase [Planctomycetota bacterium]MCH9775292.1 methionyl-tRNA formyltransferase [Planctomycetota bacterium]MDF1745601.1 formyltransferase family protein [Gimesia sp.]
MKITVFTSNQPRHISLIESLASIADEVYAVQECNTVFPGQVADFFRRSDIMQEYFSHVLNAEKNIFGSPRFSPANVKSISMKLGDLNRLELNALKPALESDYYIVFGSSFIKGDLCNFLVNQKALNIHMGVSPYYRGSSCNFWALNDGNPDFVGATIHLLSKGLDSGPMLFHALPKPQEIEAFLLGMSAVKAAHEGLVSHLKAGTIFDFAPVIQEKNLELKYTRNSDFTDEVAAHYLKTAPTPTEIVHSLDSRDLTKFLNPYLA